MDQKSAPGSIDVRATDDSSLDSIDRVRLATEVLARVGQDPLSGYETKVLGRLGVELEIRLRDPANRYSAQRSTTLLTQLHRHPDFTPEFLAGKTCVDLGCGALNPFGQLFALLLAGAHRGIAIDLENISAPDASARALFTCAAEATCGPLASLFNSDASTLLERVKSFDLAKLAGGDPSGIDTDRLTFLNKTIEASGLADGEADLIASVSFLEHVPDVDSVIGEMARITSKGGLATHTIDGHDHRYFRDPSVHPLDFLRIESDDAIVEHCNRIRPLDFQAMFERHGFEVRQIGKFGIIDVDDAMRQSFVEPFRSMSKETLETGMATFFLRRK